MQEKRIAVLRRSSGVVFTQLLEQYGYVPFEVSAQELDERDFFSIFGENPFAIILPLSLPNFAALRMAEIAALRQSSVRLILVSGTSAPPSLLRELFDCHLPAQGEGLLEALRQRGWTHAFERRTATLDVAIQNVLRTASCFWSYGERHPEAFPTLVDYQKTIADNAKHLKVLFIASDPTDLAKLRLIKEFSTIENELSRQSDHPIILKHAFSSRPDELMAKLLEEKPHIVHFSGHGDSHGRLCFEHPDGRSWPAEQAVIAKIFEPLRRHTKCVVLNTCFSAELAQLIGQYIEYAIGLNSSVTDDAAIAMAKGFYGTFRATRTISAAIQSARASLHLISYDNPTLYCAKRIPAFRGYTADDIGTATRDSDFGEQLTSSERLGAGDASVPIFSGAQHASKPSAGMGKDDSDTTAFMFMASSRPHEIPRFYQRWARCEGWFAELLCDEDDFGSMNATKGAQTVIISWRLESDDSDNKFTLRISRSHSYLVRDTEPPPR